ncbi:coiled-coil domain-containing protein [Staphylothermus hellenicus]|uniref:Uncharacterized protein n=1 Tax=Staphylothermus hellenicus (strain DSM 12710 / JCM 10830 / BK20S6-10-b1 / P8) TaxID=591019 RepID=D7DC21_STAHD|nr:hypothetical protein [Staphylothermus hellenicus]ADI31718.1 hypothetical protein Shell_0593 [Staphylothermus hellenicus DSM 12710]
MTYKYPIIPTIIDPGSLTYFDQYREAALIIYLYSVKGKKLSKMIPIYYPLLFIEGYNNRTFIIDYLNNNDFKLKYKIPNTDHIKSITLDPLSTNSLISIRKLLKEYVRGKYSLEEELVLPKVISSRSIIDELVEIVSRCGYDTLSGYEINNTHASIDIDEYIGKVNQFIYRITKTVMDILKMNEDLSYQLFIAINDIKEKYSRIHGRIDRSVNETQELIREKINLLSTEMVSELKSTEHRYRRMISSIEIQIRTIDNEIHRLISEQSMFRDKKRHAELIKELEHQQKRLRGKIKELQKSLRKDLESVKNKYTRMIRSEEKRLDLIESEKDRVSRKAVSLINHLTASLSEIESLSHSLIDKLQSYIRRLEEITIITPKMRSGIYFLRTYLVQDTDNNFEIITPLKIAPSYTGRDVLRTKYYVNTRRYILSKKVFRQIIDLAKNNYSELVKHDLLNRISYEDVKNTLYILSRNYEKLANINLKHIDRIASNSMNKQR